MAGTRGKQMPAEKFAEDQAAAGDSADGTGDYPEDTAASAMSPAEIGHHPVCRTGGTDTCGDALAAEPTARR